MTDFEINKQLAELLGLSLYYDYPHNADNRSVCVEEYLWVDYCNSWADIGEIIEEFGIGMNKVENLWEAHNGSIDQGSMVIAKTFKMDEKPLRAAALVAIKVLEGR